MFDLRYHVASLAAVFLALIIGILVGVGIADRGYLDKGTRGLLERQNADLQTKLDKTAQQAGNLGRDQAGARAYITQTYPVLVHNRLRGKRVAVVFVGSVDGGVRSAVTRALTDAGGEQLRLRALTVPIDGSQIDATLAANPKAGSFSGQGRFESLGRALGQELMLGGDTPLWNALTDVLVEQREGGNKDPADGVIVVRSAKPQKGATSRYLLGLYAGLGSAGVPAVGVEASDARRSAISVYRQAGLSSVDDIDTLAGKLALVLLLQGAPSGQYGVKKTADEALPSFQTGG
ncbi:MAG: copper transporter [Actinomycetota bacterium]|nr:copper transporter [Actinomycetota bacterium]